MNLVVIAVTFSEKMEALCSCRPRSSAQGINLLVSKWNRALTTATVCSFVFS
jgi:hypothetical protein